MMACTQTRNRITSIDHRTLLMPIILGALLLVLLGPVRTATAQGTMGMLPDPINSSELDGYLDRLGLSAEQRRAIDPHFQSYQEEFRRLRDNEIADFMREMQEMQTAGMAMPSRSDMDRLMRRWEHARNLISGLDTQFFNMIQVVLTEEQLAMIERVQMARERHRYSTEVSMGMMGRAADLSELVRQMNMTPDELRRIDPTLAEYERRLTTAMRDQSESSRNMMSDMYDALEEVGFDEEAMEDPAEMTRMMEEMQRVMQDVFAKMAEDAQAIRTLNYRTYRSISELLGETRRRAFRQHFAQQSFHELHFLTNNQTERRFDAAISMDDLDTDLRERIEQEYESYQVDRDRLFDQALRFVAENMQSPMMGMFGTGDDNSDYEQRMDEFRERVQQMDSRANDSLRELMPEEHRRKLNERVSERMQADIEERQAQMEQFRGQSNDESAALTSASSDSHLPGPINTRETAIYADLLGLNEDERMLLEQLHEEYTEYFSEHMKDIMEQVSEAQQNQWRSYQDEVSPEEGRQRVERVFELRQEALNAIAELDDAFFDDVELVVSAESAERARLARARNRAMHGLRASGTGRNRHTTVDLSDVVRLLRWTPEQREAINEILVQWERDATELLSSYYKVNQQLQKALQRFYLEMQDMTREDQQNWMEINERRQELLRDYQARAREAQEAIYELTEEARHSMLAAMSDDDAAAFDDAYRRRAFPAIYNDRRAVHTQLRSALNLPDLTESQRDALTELNLQYNAEYHALTERMVELHRGRRMPSMEAMAESDWAEYMQHESENARLEFERNELNGKVIRELRSLLDEQQRERIGGLPEPARQQRPF